MPCAAILTALPVEYLAVRANLTNIREDINPQGTIYEWGEFAGIAGIWDVGIAEVGAGNTGTGIEAERAIAYLDPDILFFVGVAGGIKDVEIGDVVAATKVYGYESGKIEEQFLTRPALGQSAYALIQRAKAEARKTEWLNKLIKRPTLQPRVFVAPIAAGEKIINSKRSELFQFLRANYNDAIAVEMEGFGFLSAAFAYPNIKAIVIRGISDLVEGKNDDSVESEEERQKQASEHARAFAFEILEKFQVEESNRDRMSLATVNQPASKTNSMNKFKFCTKLGDSHNALALYFNIPRYDRDRWESGSECERILEWLENRDRFHELRDALLEIDRKDLIDFIRET